MKVDVGQNQCGVFLAHIKGRLPLDSSMGYLIVFLLCFFVCWDVQLVHRTRTTC